MSVLVVLERSGAGWNRASWEALTAGRDLAAATGASLEAVVLGRDPEAPAAEAAARQVSRVWALAHELLEPYTPEAWTNALEALVRKEAPAFMVFPHTYQVRDFAPRLAARFGQVLASDVIRIRTDGGEPVFVRQYFQGKLNGDLRFTGQGPHFVSIQAGSHRAGEAGTSAGTVEMYAPPLEAPAIRTRPQEPVRETARAVDLTAAERIVAVGRGIKEKENLPMVEELARALEAELAASRPICDNGWMAMERQVGSSGQSVAPKLYLAVGISGAIQHLVGMKGARTIVAINKDPEAPIFEVADYGIAADLFEVVPALTEEIRKARGG